LPIVGVIAQVKPPRHRVDIHATPWQSLGKLQSVAGSLRETCTGSLIGTGMVLTAALCLYNRRTNRFFLPSSIAFLLGLEGGQYAAAARVEAFILAPGQVGPPSPEAAGNDWAILELASRLTVAPTLALAGALPRAGTAIAVAGYGQDNPNVITGDTAYQVTGLSSDRHNRPILLHDCATVRGVSGAPILLRTENEWQVAGIAVARDAAGTVGIAVPVAGMRIDGLR